ncbi:MAG: DUF4288 domain-containing protein [Bacteroidia bacterium]
MTNEKSNTDISSENWYLAKIVFRIIIGNSSDSQFDIQYRLISAINIERAMEKAEAIGYKMEGIFLNVQQENVSWKFIDISGIHQLDLSVDGSELYAETYETKDPDNYIDTVCMRAKACRESGNFVSR